MSHLLSLTLKPFHKNHKIDVQRVNLVCYRLWQLTLLQLKLKFNALLDLVCNWVIYHLPQQQL